MKVTMKAGHLHDLIDTYSLPAGSERLFPILPLKFTTEGISCSVASNEKTSGISGKWTPAPYTVDTPQPEAVLFSAEDVLPILGRFGPDDIITVTLDKTMKFTGPGKEFTHYPPSELNVIVMPKEPTFDAKRVMITAGGPSTTFFTADATAFQAVLDDGKVVDSKLGTYPMTLSKEGCFVRLGESDAKKDFGVTKLLGHFDGEDQSFILGAELAYTIKNMKGDVELQAVKDGIVAFIKNTTKPAGRVVIFIAPKVAA